MFPRSVRGCLEPLVAVGSPTWWLRCTCCTIYLFPVSRVRLFCNSVLRCFNCFRLAWGRRWWCGARRAVICGHLSAAPCSSLGRASGASTLFGTGSCALRRTGKSQHSRDWQETRQAPRLCCRSVRAPALLRLEACAEESSGSLCKYGAPDDEPQVLRHSQHCLEQAVAHLGGQVRVSTHEACRKLFKLHGFELQHFFDWRPALKRAVAVSVIMEHRMMSHRCSDLEQAVAHLGGQVRVSTHETCRKLFKLHGFEVQHFFDWRPALKRAVAVSVIMEHRMMSLRCSDIPSIVWNRRWRT